ncbi:disease resistance protein [Salix suchowensis]|nr:disease resistance protein [Salix suchowensis]
MEGAPPSSVEDDVNITCYRLELEQLLSGHPSYVILRHILSEDDCLQCSFSTIFLITLKKNNKVTEHGSRLPPEEVPVNQSSMLCNDQAGQNLPVDYSDSIQQTTQFPTSFPQTMTTMGGLDGTSSSLINQNGPNWPQNSIKVNDIHHYLFIFFLPHPLPLPHLPLPLPLLLLIVRVSDENCYDQQWTNQVPMSNQVSGMLPQPPMNQWHQNSFIHQPQSGHVYLTQNATTSQHGGFNQPTPRYPIFNV